MQARLDAILAREDAILALLRAAAPAPSLISAATVAEPSSEPPAVNTCSRAASYIGSEGLLPGGELNSSYALIRSVGPT